VIHTIGSRSDEGRRGDDRVDPRTGFYPICVVPAARSRPWQAYHMIVGIGVDVADVARLQDALERTPALASRLFADSERGRPIRSLAGCFAAKEAVAKALGGPSGLRWLDVVVRHDGLGKPEIAVSGTVAAAAARLGITDWHVSISHDAGICVAMVVAER
jgi:holo-[acyl-carrier protein] synthase